MTDEEIKTIAEDAASLAVHGTFRMFGVDTQDQDSVNNFRADLVFARELRKATKGVQSKILMIVCTAIVVGALAAMAKGFGFTSR